MTDTSRKRVVVIGAGLAGIITAIEFKKRLGIDVSLYEREAGPGGTWRVNTYPGCACDIPSQWYSLSSELNPNWSTAFSKQPEIQAYWDAIFLKYELQKHTRFNVSFVRADWDAARQLHIIQFESTADAKQSFEVEAEILVSAIGGFSSPLDKPPGLRGIERFEGDLFHSARWNHSVDLKNKRVGVIGNGCSAAQFVPEIAKEKTTSVVNFVRKAAKHREQLWIRICLVSDSVVVLAALRLANFA